MCCEWVQPKSILIPFFSRTSHMDNVLNLIFWPWSCERCANVWGWHLFDVMWLVFVFAEATVETKKIIRIHHSSFGIPGLGISLFVICIYYYLCYIFCLRKHRVSEDFSFVCVHFDGAEISTCGYCRYGLCSMFSVAPFRWDAIREQKPFVCFMTLRNVCILINDFVHVCLFVCLSNPPLNNIDTLHTLSIENPHDQKIWKKRRIMIRNNFSFFFLVVVVVVMTSSLNETVRQSLVLFRHIMSTKIRTPSGSVDGDID